MRVDFVPGINRDRIDWCCEQFGVSRHQLAEQCGIRLDNLDDFFENATELSVSQLEKIAKFFGKGILFFLEQEPPSEEAIQSPQFRRVAGKDKQMSVRLRKFISNCEQVREKRLQFAEELEELIPPFEPPGFTKFDNIEAYAERCRRWLALDGCQTFEQYRKQIESTFVLVLRSNGYSGKWKIDNDDNISGFCLFYDTLPIIAVKKEEHEPRQTFTLFHELGHLLLHKNSFVDDSHLFDDNSVTEREANAFAGAILLPFSLIEQLNWAVAPKALDELLEFIQPLAKRTGVSNFAVLYRITKLRLVEFDLFKEYCERPKPVQVRSKKSIPRTYRHREPLQIFGQPYVASVVQTFREKGISLTKATQYLDEISISDFRKLEDYVKNH